MTMRFAKFKSREQLRGSRTFECFALLAAGGLWVLLRTLELASAQPPPSPTGGSATGTAPEARDDVRSSYRVLLLYSEARLTPSVVRTDQALRSTLEARSPRPVYFYTEFLDLNSFRGSALQDELVKLLRVKYRQRPIDLIVAQGQLTVPFVLQNRADLFSSPPVAFVSVEPSTFADLSSDSTVTGTWRARGWGETLELARRLHPGMRRAVVVVGASEAERLWADSAREQLAAHAGPIEITYLVGSSSETVLKTIAALPKDAVVLAGPFLRDGTGRDFTMNTFMSQMMAVARVPVYGLTEGTIGTGVVGGHVVSFEAHGKVAAGLALLVLAGEHPSPTTEGTTVPTFDDRQLVRWGIDSRLLPPGSVVLFHELSLWERYRSYVIGAAGLVVLQSALIGLLLLQRAQRRRTQRSLADRLRFETLLSNLSPTLSSCPSAAIDREIEMGLRRIVEDLGTDRAILWSLDDRVGEARVTHAWARAGIPPMVTVIKESQFPWILARIREGKVLRLPSPTDPDEAPVDRHGLAQLGTRSTAVAPLVEGGVVVGGLSVGAVLELRHWPDELVPRLRLLADVFANALARQHAEQAAHASARDIRDLAGQLLTAEDDERRRIARELHDGVNQDLASLSIALSVLEDGLPADTPDDRRREIARLHARAVELAEAIRYLSHELHPGILQYAGLATALRSHCREFDASHEVRVTYRSDDLGHVPADVALCVYRVTQEALKNAAMHARARQAWVTVAREEADLVLTIRDDGSGFDLAKARGRGLGLISLEERVRHVGGRLVIDTEPQRGTTIRVVVPLS
jgi:signal transduction histidine kinase